MNATILVSVLAAGWLAQSAPQAQGTPVSGNLKVRIATSTYMTDGRVLTASASDWPLRLNEPMVAFASSGKTLCEPKAASTQQPELPAYGWRLQITPIRESAGALEVRVEWRQLGIARKETLGRRLANPGTALTLHAGDRIVLDYVTATSAFGLFAFAREGEPRYFISARTRQNVAGAAASGTPAATPAPACSAVGMALEIGLESAKIVPVVEAELWLVRPNRDGTERSDRQVLRLPVGQPASRYFFDEARLADPAAGTFAKVSGDLSVVAVENGQIRFNFNVMRKSGKSPSADTASSFRDLTAAIGEVVAFKLPPDDPRTDPPLSIRLRANLLR